MKILDGSKSIGGTKILLTHKKTRILLDFGFNFAQNKLFYSEFIQPRKCDALGDFFEMGLLPDVKGIYREDYLKHMGRPKEKRSVDAVFLTHAHYDHAIMNHFLRVDIPIYCSQGTKNVLTAIEKTGQNSFKDLVTYLETYMFKRGNSGPSKITRKDTDYVKDREFNTMKSYKKYTVGDLKIEMLPVDHTIPGSAGFIVYSDDGNVVYTGDLRLHGYRKNDTEKFIQKATRAKPTYLIVEGTNVGDREPSISEQKVSHDMTKLMSQGKGHVFAEFPPRDLDRFRSIYNAAKRCGRTMVVGMKLAYLIEKFEDQYPFKLSNMKILIPKKEWGLISKKQINVDDVSKKIDDDIISKEYSIWEREYVLRDNAITTDDIRKNPKKYVVAMSLWDIKSLIDIKPKNAIWIKSKCEPFDPELEIDEERKLRWIEHFKIKEYHTHSSGHMSEKEIKDMIKKIKPKKVVPIHTEHPELF